MTRLIHLRWSAVLGVVGLSVLLTAARWGWAETQTLHNTLPDTNDVDASTEQPDNAVGADKDEVPALQTRMPLRADNVPVGKLLDDLAKNAKLNLVVNWVAMQGAGVDRNTPVTVNLPAAVTVETILTIVCRDVGGGQSNLGFTTMDGSVIVSTRDELQSAKYQVVRMYDIADLVDMKYYPNSTYDERLRNIIATITGVVAPDTWRDAGGTVGSLRELNDILIINQTRDNHRQIAAVLAKLRAILAARHR